MLRFHFLLDQDLDPESYPGEQESESRGSGSLLDPNPSLDRDPIPDSDPMVDPNPLRMIKNFALFWIIILIQQALSVRF